MDRDDLFRAVGAAPNALLERSERRKGRHRRWLRPLAAVLALALLGGIGLWLAPRPAVDPADASTDTSTGPGNPFLLQVSALAEPEYPEMAPYPDYTNYEDDWDGYKAASNAWYDSRAALEQPEGYAGGLEDFFTATFRQFLSGEPENRAYSPLNVYFALGMLAELTNGQSRAQILGLLGSDSIEALRTQARAVWLGQYRDDGATETILASSLWLDAGLSYTQSTLDRLADTYYASSYQGEMGSEAMNQALQAWLNDQTGGLLEDQVGGVELSPQTVLALATTIYYRAKWVDEFSESATAPGAFHSPAGDVTCDFLHQSQRRTYYWGDTFSAVGLPLENDGGTLWLLLPGEGVTVQNLLDGGEAMAFLGAGGDWENRKNLTVHLSMPKFDISAQTDLREGLQALGVTDVFDAAAADFSPMMDQAEGLAVSQVKHGVRVAVDEEGVAAAAYTVMPVDGATEPPEDEVDFVLDRPFLFCLTSADGLPLFAGTVANPAV